MQSVSVDSLFGVQVTVGADVLPQEFLYPSHAPSQPTHSRRFYGLSHWGFQLSQSFTADLLLNYYFRDQGVISNDVYWVSSENYEVLGDLGLSYSQRWMQKLSLGSGFKRQRIAFWGEKEGGVVYQISPYLLASVEVERSMLLQIKIKHYIDIVGTSNENYWDVAMNLVVEK